MIQQEKYNQFNKIYHDTYGDISKYVVCKCSNIKDVENILQNIYLEVFRYLENHDNVSKTYIIGISKNKIRDYYRFSYKTKILSLFSNAKEQNFIDRISSDIDIEKSIENKYDTEKVWEYLKRKKQVISRIFYLYYYLDIKIIEIAQELQLTESNVKHYLYRTLTELQKYIESNGDKNVQKSND